MCCFHLIWPQSLFYKEMSLKSKFDHLTGWNRESGKYIIASEKKNFYLFIIFFCTIGVYHNMMHISNPEALSYYIMTFIIDKLLFTGKSIIRLLESFSEDIPNTSFESYRTAKVFLKWKPWNWFFICRLYIRLTVVTCRAKRLRSTDVLIFLRPVLS